MREPWKIGPGTRAQALATRSVDPLDPVLCQNSALLK